ncbi:MAG: mechanosensitive ion channel family protein [Myxococcaceae bacterium]|nr:mechanosensitive ion channel family protein [Myxococcaceae bacterium]
MIRSLRGALVLALLFVTGIAVADPLDAGRLADASLDATAADAADAAALPEPSVTAIPAPSAPTTSTAETPPAPVDHANEHPAPSASASSSAAAGHETAPAGSANPNAPSVVRVHEREVFTIKVPRAGQTVTERARGASEALGTLLEGEADVPAPRVEEHGAVAVVFVGSTPIITLGPEDAAAEGDVALDVHAASVATRIQEAVRLERKRAAIAKSVFSFSLLIFSALIAFFLLGRIGVIEDKIRAWMDGHPARLPALRLGKIEVVSRPAVRGVIGIALRIGNRLAQLAIAYAWLIIALSLFDATRGYTAKLTGFVVTPMSALLGRAGSALPVLVVGIIAAIAVSLVMRFVCLFFGSVARGETKLGWLPSDLAAPTSVLVRMGIAIASLIAVAPLITGSDEGALSRAGVAALVTVALACTPVLACAAVGVPIVFGRRLRNGDFIEAGGCAGRVKGVTLLEVRLEDVWGCEVRVPHLLGLWHATRIVGRTPMMTIAVTVDARASQAMVREALRTAANKVSDRAKIELVSLDADGARYRVSCPDEPGADLAVAIADALASSGIGLGRNGNHGSADAGVVETTP